MYSVDIWPVRKSRLIQRETNHYLARCASVLAWSYLAGRSPEQLVIDLFAQHHRFVVGCPLEINWIFTFLQCLAILLDRLENGKCLGVLANLFSLKNQRDLPTICTYQNTNSSSSMHLNFPLGAKIPFHH